MIYFMGLFCICGLFVVFRVVVSRGFGYDVGGLDTGLFVVCGTHFRTGRIWVKVCEIIYLWDYILSNG